MPDRRKQLLPSPLLVAVGGLGVITLIVGEYLEWRRTAWLQLHPITANLISSIIGFCTVTIVVGVGFALYSDRFTRRSSELPLVHAMHRQVAIVAVYMKSTEIGKHADILTFDHEIEAGSLRAFAKDFREYQWTSTDAPHLVRLYREAVRIVPAVRFYLEDYVVGRSDLSALAELERQEAALRDMDRKDIDISPIALTGEAAVLRSLAEEVHGTARVVDGLAQIAATLSGYYVYLSTVRETFTTV
ncbi:hypothetical protein ACIA5C_47820 [Actinoplanes sp. NPDC051343]|uniref:hypothetical protein n=1 Tax=Actinoplanes sp. NPDC051343 TaxID=3363906 RepID=UPI0037AE367E